MPFVEKCTAQIIDRYVLGISLLNFIASKRRTILIAFVSGINKGIYVLIQVYMLSVFIFQEGLCTPRHRFGRIYVLDIISHLQAVSESNFCCETAPIRDIILRLLIMNR